MLDPELAARRLREDERICKALRFSGAHVSSIFDLVNTRSPYPHLIDALIQVLPTVEELWIREGVIRALTVKEARGKAGPVLIAEFRNPALPDTYRWAVGNALSVVATPELFEEIASLLVNREFGTSRQMLPAALVRAGKRRAEAVLLPLLAEPDILPTVIRELGKLRSKAALPQIRKLTSHEKTLVRSEARKALSRIEAT